MLFELYRKTDELSQRGPILEVLTQLLQAARELYALSGPSYDPTERRTLAADRVLIEHKDDLLGCLSSGIQTANFKKPALEAYMQAVQIEGLLSADELGFVVQSVNDLILSEEADQLRWAPIFGSR